MFFFGTLCFLAQLILNVANGPKFCSTYAYLHARILGIGDATTLRNQRLGILYLACFICIKIENHNFKQDL